MPRFSEGVICSPFVSCQRLSSINCRIDSQALHRANNRAKIGIAKVLRISAKRTALLKRSLLEPVRKDRAFHRFPPHLSHNVATFWVKDMQCFVDSQPFAAAVYPGYGEPDEVVATQRPFS